MVWREPSRVNKQRRVLSLLQVAVIIQTTMPATYLAGVPVALQRMVFALLGKMGRGLGYRAAYPEYGVLPRDVAHSRGRRPSRTLPP